MDAIQSALGGAQLSVAIGTSGSVNLAAGFVAQAGALGIPTAANRCFPGHAARQGLAAVDETQGGTAKERARSGDGGTTRRA